MAGQKERKVQEKEVEGQISLFGKEALMNSRRYRGQRDLLAVLLEDDRPYSLAQADAEIQKFRKSKRTK